MDKAFLIALREEYAAAHSGKQPPMMAEYWKFAAETILNAFTDFSLDASYDWQHEIVDKHISSILAECPELANDEDSLAHQDN